MLRRTGGTNYPKAWLSKDFDASRLTEMANFDTYFHYNRSAGELYFDPDGSGEADPLLLVTIVNHAKLTWTELEFI